MSEPFIIECNSQSNFNNVLGLSGDVVVIMPALDRDKALGAARILIERSGLKEFCLIIALDDRRVGFVSVVNEVYRLTNFKYLVYLAEDAFPGRYWLRRAYDLMESSNGGLLAFNDGKWFGEYAAFGMVRKSWVERVYEADLFFPTYHSHFADVELTKIAERDGQLIYDPNAVLVEVDFSKGLHWRANQEDQVLYFDRLKKGFPDGRDSRTATAARVFEALESRSYREILTFDYECFNSNYAHVKSCQSGLSIIIPSLNGLNLLRRLFGSIGNIKSLVNVEFIIIDHASNDGSADYIRELSSAYGNEIFRLLVRERNYSFSESCNFAASISRYDSLLFCNNDVEARVEVIQRFLDLLHESESTSLLGIQIFDSDRRTGGLRLSHDGIGFRWSEERGYFQPYNIARASSASPSALGRSEFLSAPVTLENRIAVTAAFMGIKRELFNAVGGFSEAYYYGCEDVDLCMKTLVYTRRWPRLLTGMSVVHNEMTTRRGVLGADIKTIIDSNHQKFKARWGDITALLSEC